MTRRGLREQVFKMLFRVEFHNVEDMPEQMNMFEEVEECARRTKKYSFQQVPQHCREDRMRSMQRSMRFPRVEDQKKWEK